MTSTTVIVTFSTDDIAAVRDWLAECQYPPFANDAQAFKAYINAVVVSNSDWDGVSVWSTEEVE